LRDLEFSDQVTDSKEVFGEKALSNQSGDPLFFQIHIASELVEHGCQRAPYRGVAGAATDVTRDRLDRFALIPPSRFEEVSRECNHETGRTEPALRGTFVCESLLDGSELASVETLDGHNVVAMQRTDRQQAGGDDPVVDGVGHRLAQQNDTRTAVPLTARIFDARQTGVIAQEIEGRQPGVGCSFHQAIIKGKSQHCFP